MTFSFFGNFPADNRAMSTKKRYQGPSLPKFILEHIDRQDASGNSHRSKNTHLARKDARKQERLDRKKRRADHFSTRVVAVKPKTEEEHVDVPDSKRRKTVRFADEVKSSSPLEIHRTLPRGAHERSDSRTSTKSESKPTALEKLASKSTRKAPKVASRVPRTREEAEEDAHIAYLEAKLGYSNGDKRRNSDEADGLDDLLDFANGLEVSFLDVPGHSDANLDRDLDTWHIPDDGESSEVGQASDNPSQCSPSDDDDKVEAEELDGSDEWTGFSTSDNELPQLDQATEITDIKESETRPSGLYIPPSLRKESRGSEGEDIVKLTRQLKGLINRMSEQNMSSVLDAIEEVYRNHRRHDVTSTLTTLIIDGISSHSMLLDSFVVLHAAFISSLHKLIGVEFAAFVVQSVVSAYQHHLQDYESDIPDVTTQSEERGKEGSNLIVLLSELYNFQVISCILLYDIIKDLLAKTLSEFRVELLLKILRNSGQQLRQDDPSALKDIVTLAQSSIEKQADSLSSRTKFLIETLTNLKNNKIKKSATQHQGGDAVERMKKFMSGLGKKRHVQAHEALRVSFGDLRAAETKGKWWLVGAAWAGDPLVDQRDTSTTQHEVAAEDIGNMALVKLARKQGMNTDIRRSIFVVLMSSDDYLDACERLAQLNLSEVQQREIVRVILHCCGNEKSYNPYYTLVCQQLCQKSHAYKITLQFCLWDFLRDLGETSVGGTEVIKNLKDDDGRFELKAISSSRMKNMAKAYGWWIAKDCCSITILKPIDFTMLKPQTQKFLRELFVQIFVASQASSAMLTDDVDEQTSRNRGTVEDIFVKATKIKNLGFGLIFFLSNAFRREEGLLGWASALAKETVQTGMNEIPRL